MKYGQTLQQRSIPLWETCEREVHCSQSPSSKVLNGHATTDNVDYNDIKHLIKLRTTQGQGQAKAIPGSDNESRAFHAFEDELYRELRDQHQRIDLFVQSKSGEIARRLGTSLVCLPSTTYCSSCPLAAHLDKQIAQLEIRGPSIGHGKMSLRRLEKYSRLEEAAIK